MNHTPQNSVGFRKDSTSPPHLVEFKRHDIYMSLQRHIKYRPTASQILAANHVSSRSTHGIWAASMMVALLSLPMPLQMAVHQESSTVMPTIQRQIEVVIPIEPKKLLMEKVQEEKLIPAEPIHIDLKKIITQDLRQKLVSIEKRAESINQTF